MSTLFFSSPLCCPERTPANKPGASDLRRGAAINPALPGARITGASPVNDATMAASVRARKVVQVEQIGWAHGGAEMELLKAAARQLLAVGW
jgi:hypothetical protein